MRGLRIALSIALLGALSIALLGLSGCTSLGPATIRRDRVDFAEAIIDAAKRETLLNIVKLRYADTPGLVSVSQLVAGYSLNTSATVGTAFQQQTFNFANDVNLGVSGSFSENPTVTYTPVAGEDFARVMLTPIPPSELFAMVAAGATARHHARPRGAVDQRPAQLVGQCRAARPRPTPAFPRCWACSMSCGATARWASASRPKRASRRPSC